MTRAVFETLTPIHTASHPNLHSAPKSKMPFWQSTTSLAGLQQNFNFTNKSDAKTNFKDLQRTSDTLPYDVLFRDD